MLGEPRIFRETAPSLTCPVLGSSLVPQSGRWQPDLTWT